MQDREAGRGGRQAGSFHVLFLLWMFGVKGGVGSLVLFVWFTTGLSINADGWWLIGGAGLVGWSVLSDLF